MNILNVVFGLVTVMSFGYAIWTNRRLHSLETQRNRAISTIRDIANQLYQRSPDSFEGATAYSVIRICDSLVPPDLDGRVVGRLRLDYCPWEQPPMHSHGGNKIHDARARLGAAWESQRSGERPRFYAVFGPYHHLPVLGYYEVSFWIALPAEAEPTTEDTRVLRLDAYAYVDSKTILSERFITRRELSQEYKEFRIGFEYTLAGRVLEYRVELLKEGLTIRVSDIRVEYKTLR